MSVGELVIVRKDCIDFWPRRHDPEKFSQRPTELYPEFRIHEDEEQYDATILENRKYNPFAFPEPVMTLRFPGRSCWGVYTNLDAIIERGQIETQSGWAVSDGEATCGFSTKYSQGKELRYLESLLKQLE